MGCLSHFGGGMQRTFRHCHGLSQSLRLRKFFDIVLFPVLVLPLLVRSLFSSSVLTRWFAQPQVAGFAILTQNEWMNVGRGQNSIVCTCVVSFLEFENQCMWFDRMLVINREYREYRCVSTERGRVRPIFLVSFWENCFEWRRTLVAGLRSQCWPDIFQVLTKTVWNPLQEQKYHICDSCVWLQIVNILLSLRLKSLVDFKTQSSEQHCISVVFRKTGVVSN